jgi:class 3 adenylate cyclase
VVQIDQRLEMPTLAAIRARIPTQFNGSDAARPLLFGAIVVAILFLRGAAFKFDGDVKRFRQKRDALIKASGILDAGKLDRAKLLEVYAEVRKSLDEQKQHMAFLSIDIVDSTGMKIGEDPGIAENDFRQYKKMVEDILGMHRSVKAAWTPDGVMIAFSSAADALRAAMAVIAALEDFNKTVKHIKRDFRIRAGVNAGDVFCDAETPMEEMTDRVIDIAGHMQKHGIVDGVCVSKHSVETLLEKLPFKDAGRVVDGCPVYEWKKGDSAAKA